MKRKQRLLGIVVLSVTLPLLLLLWLVDRQYRQEQRNHALIAAIKQQNRPRVLELLSAGADANASDTGDSLTLLQMLKRLNPLARGQAKKADSTYHPSALIVASQRLELRGFIITSAGMVLHVRTSVPITRPNITIRNQTPLLRGKPDEEIVLALLDHGADPNLAAVPRPPTTLLQYSLLGDALINRHNRVLRRLLERGANPNTPAMLLSSNTTVLFHSTPLVLAMGQQNIEAVQLLLQHGANVSQKDAQGKTALDYVRNSNDSQARRIAALLRQYGAQ